jgi:KDO2-lipid IV(A) lauroyltransferase
MLFVLAESVARMPRWMADGVARVLGSLLFLASPRKRYLTLGNLGVAYPDSAPAWRRQIARRALCNSVSEIFFGLRMTRVSKEQLAAQCVNLAELHEVLERDRLEGKGVVILGAHLGNPTLLSVTASLVAPVTGLGTPYSRNQAQQDYIQRQRARLGLTFVPYDEWPLELLYALRRQEIVTLVTDQRPRRNRRFVWVPFFSVRVRAIPFPAELARLAGAVMRPIFMVREGSGYRAIIHERIPVPTKAEGEAGLRAAARRWTELLEQEVRPRPAQWMWTLRRWQQSPDDPPVPVLPLPQEASTV